MRYFKAIVAYEPISPEKKGIKKELTLFCCDDTTPPDSKLQKLFSEHHHDKKFLEAWFHEIKLLDIPVTELIHPLCIEKTMQNDNLGFNYLLSTDNNTAMQ